MIYIYGIVEHGCVLPATAMGIDDTPVTLVDYRNIAAIVGVTPSQRVPLAESNLWRHEQLVERLMTDHAVLPACYGTVLKDEREIRDILAANYAGFVSNLDRVRGCVELSLRVLWDDESPIVAIAQANHASALTRTRTPPQGGRAYMTARLKEDREERAHRQRGEVHIERIDGVLATRSIQHTRKTFITPHLLLTAAYLVQREHIGNFQETVQMLAATESRLQFLCTGPWPPYSFVDVKVAIPSQDIAQY